MGAGTVLTQSRNVTTINQPGEPERLCCSAVLPDMDDTLVSTKGAWQRAESAALAELGGTYTEHDARALTGRSMRETAEYLIRQAGAGAGWEAVAARIRAHLLWIFRHDPHAVRLLPGVPSLLSGLKLNIIPSVLVTSSDYQLMYHVLALTGIVLDYTVCAKDAEPKPSPEPYLVAARLAWADPGECIAIEDSRTGVDSAEAAGVGRVIVVPSPGQEIGPGPGRLIVQSLADVSVWPGGLEVRNRVA
jgi:HAD superfamily hydrolase (TIGR01509 family)